MRLPSNFSRAEPSERADALTHAARSLSSDNPALLVPDCGAPIDVSSSPELQRIPISLANSASMNSAAQKVQRPLVDENEGYELVVHGDGSDTR